MISTKIIIGLAVLTIFCVTYSESIACYSCDNKSSCNKPAKVECTQALANTTRAYLDNYHKNVPNTTNPFLECFREYHKSTSGEFYYKGCIFSHVRGCNLELKDFYQQGKFERTCSQCTNKNYCNPAGRAELSVGLPIVTIILTVLTKYLWSN